MTKKPLKAIDFFCGAGGMTYGMTRAGIEVIAGIDIDESCKETYEINNPGSTFIHSDITLLKPSDLKKQLKITKNDDNMIFIGCSPCQYWTKIKTNKEKSKKTRNLLIDFEKFVEYFNPGHIVIENVPGLMTNQKEKILSQFLNFLEDKKYNVVHDVIHAEKHGVPQTRKRFLLIASRINEVNLPEEESSTNMTVRHYIGVSNGFKPIAAGTYDKTKLLHTACGLSENNLRRIRITPKDGGNRMSWRKSKKLQIPTYEGRDKDFKDVYGRMYWDKPAPTITTKFHSLSNGRFGHPEEDRALSLREGATLQTFPKSYKFKGTSIAGIARQIGNAVPPELAKRVGCCIVERRKS